MKRYRVFLALSVVALSVGGALGLHHAERSQAQVRGGVLNSGYDLSWWTVDSGGVAFSTSGDYRLGGTIGQPDAGARLSEGSYTLAQGFWYPGNVSVLEKYPVYLPIVVK